MGVAALDHVNLRVPPGLLEEVRRFYCEVVGLRAGERPVTTPGYWLYAGERAVVHLSTLAADELAPGGAVDHVAFRCTDIAATSARLASLGVPHRAREFAGRGLRQLFLRDPAGLGVELNFEDAPGAVFDGGTGGG